MCEITIIHGQLNETWKNIVRLSYTFQPVKHFQGGKTMRSHNLTNSVNIDMYVCYFIYYQQTIHHLKDERLTDQACYHRPARLLHSTLMSSIG